ncbi:hypothetical protein [Afifella sp. IM 167]|uniref:hypothetical protein n=1 Tax=Afifella sp. IM 167 TaxID=2033586 RepID=UPI001CCC37EF|nr:hypothetical protein [Afifella sp. IM 167]MBZ8133203.1 hypothetical protein [Afifella sp. IM 167]
MTQITRAVARALVAARIAANAIRRRAKSAAGAAMRFGVTAILNVFVRLGLGMKTYYRFECVGPDGRVKWTELVPNLVVNEGLNDLLDKYFKGSGYTAAWYVGLKGTGTIAASDTLASHAGWSEITAYAGDRKALTLGTVASQSVDNSASAAVFAINGTATVAGAFVAGAATGTSAVLYGAANFASARDVVADDTLNVTVTLTAADAG